MRFCFVFLRISVVCFCCVFLLCISVLYVFIVHIYMILFYKAVSKRYYAT